MTLPNKYDHKLIEKKWQNHWRQHEIYKWQNNKTKDQTFVIDTPPPTVSGVLHMGHVFSYVQADFIARFQRMIGKDVFYPMGFDDNGLPTERLVEKIIGKKAGIYEAENGQGSFVEKCRSIVEKAEEEFEDLFNQIALSVDWSQKYQTISPTSQKISQASFIDLYNKKFVKKKNEPVFWDISDKTALAQADLIDKEVDGAMHDIIFKDESDNDLIIMTTRPELLPACVAVMINPDDERFKHFIKNNLNKEGEGATGSYAITAMFGVKVPIIADKLVQMDKGTGAVMCCTFGDETDISWWRKYKLATNVIIGGDGKLNQIIIASEELSRIDKEIQEEELDFFFDLSSAPVITKENCLDCKKFKKYYEDLVVNKKIKEVRVNIVEELEKQNLLKAKQPIKHSIKCAERSGVPIEIIVQPQWFIKILDKKEQLKAKANECNWYPDYMKVRIEQWIDGLSWDWCISRQRFFGVKFPVWQLCINGVTRYPNYKDKTQKKAIARIQDLPVDPMKDLPFGYELVKEDNGQGNKIIRDKEGIEWILYPETDIMDTWATSSISPQLSSHGISQDIDLGENERHKKLFPADLRPQAHEIIRSWAFYTIVKALLHEDKAPWKNLMISGWCLAADKTKMSKSKGNVVTPTALIEEKGSDIVRYWASTSHLGADSAYSEDVFKIGKKLVTKIFNAAKFVDHICANNKNIELNQEKITEDFDKWVLSKLHLAIKDATLNFEKYEYARAREVIEDFFWNDFCDNYLEICKVRAYGTSAQKYQDIDLSQEQKIKIESGQISAMITLNICLQNILRLFTPFVPHICDEIYSSIYIEEFKQIKSLNSCGNWPQEKNLPFDQNLKENGDESLKIIARVRKFKSENNLSMKTPLKNIAINSPKDLLNMISDLKNVCNCQEIELKKGCNDDLVEISI